MPIIAICRDGRDAARFREEARRSHGDHLRGLVDDLNLAAPLAGLALPELKDSSRGFGDLLVFEGDDIEKASATIRSDPYFETGAWDVVDLFRTGPLYGAWSGDEANQRLALSKLIGDGEMLAAPMSGRPYAVLAEARTASPASEGLQLEHLRYLARQFNQMLAGCPLEHQASIGHGVPATDWSALYIYLAATPDDAQRLADNDPFSSAGFWAACTFAMPASIGKWTGVAPNE